MDELEAQVKEKKAKETLRKGRVSFVANTFLESLSPVANTHVVSGTWAKLFTLFIVTLTVATFGLMFWYAIWIECTTGSLFVFGLKGTESGFVDSFLSQQNILKCGALGKPVKRVEKNNTEFGGYVCCDIKSGQPGTSGNCHAFKSLWDECKPVQGEPPCFDDNGAGFAEVQIAYAQCTTLSTAFVTAVQYGTYVAEFICLVYLLVRVMKKHGILGVFSGASWNDVFHNAQEVEKIKKAEIEMNTVKHVDNPIRRAKPKPPPPIPV
jgi:hypothetical protein